MPQNNQPRKKKFRNRIHWSWYIPCKKQSQLYDPKGKLVHELTESFQYHLLNRQTNLHESMVSVDILTEQNMQTVNLPIDTYKKDVDELVPNQFNNGLGTTQKRYQTIMD